MPFHQPGFFLPGFFAILTVVFSLTIALVAIVIAAGLIFLLVRFLLVATRAAELYLAGNSAPAQTEADVTPTGPIDTQPDAAPTVAETPPPTKPVPRTRAPKTPPS
jgi:hypothetical protein